MSSQSIGTKLAQVFQDVDHLVDPLLELIDVRDLSAHNSAYLAYGSDKFHHFVTIEKPRFIKAVETVLRHQPTGVVCDLGSFIPYVPLALARLGYEVKIVDHFAVYGRPFHDLMVSLASKHNMHLFNLDLLNSNIEVLGLNDIVILMAVVEHLNGSPRRLLMQIRDILKPSGFLLFEVPNIAEITRRLAFLTGKSPLPEYQTYFHSEYPFMGHNREMTNDEVVYLLTKTGFTIRWLECYDYWQPDVTDVRSAIVKLVKMITPIRTKGQSIMATAYKN